MLQDLPSYVFDVQFWFAIVPAIFCAFVLGYIWRVRPRRYLTFWRPSALDPVLGQVSDDTLTALSSAVKLTPEAIHTYMGLGNLYRSRGEFDKATRIHGAIAKRDDVPKQVQTEAVYHLALDHTQAGLMDRAEQLLRRVLREAGRKQPLYPLALTALAKLLERQRRWADALAIRAQLTEGNGANKASQAHLLVKIAETHLADNNPKDAIKALQEALQTSPSCIPALRLLAEQYLKQNRADEACALLTKHAPLKPSLFHLLHEVLIHSFITAKKVTELKTLWQSMCADPRSTWHTAAGYAAWLNSRHLHKEALDVLTQTYDRNPAVIEAAAALGQQFEDMNNPEGSIKVLKTHLQEKSNRVMLYRCSACGYSSRTPFWHCQQCHTWDSLTPITSPTQTD